MASTKVPIELSSTPGIVDNSNATAITIDSSENVGIGTTSGVQKLTVAVNDSYTDVASGTASLELTNTNGTNGTYSRIYFNDAAGGAASGILGVKLTDTTNNYGQFEFWTRGSGGNATRMVIDPNGNVGINTTSPAYNLSVGTVGTTANSYIQIGTTTTGAGNLFFGDTSGTGTGSYSGYVQYDHNVDAMILGTASTERLRINSSGYVGIGTSSPASKLHITGTGAYNHTPGQNTTSDFIITSSEMNDNNYHSIMQLVSVRQSLATGSGANGYIGFSTIDDSNAQGVRDAGRIAIVNENGTARNSSTALSFWTNAGGTDTTAATEKMRIDSLGNVGIGTSSPANYSTYTTLNVGQNTVGSILQLNGATSSNYHLVQNNDGAMLISADASNTGASSVMIFQTGGTERMRIESDGEVAVGTTTVGTSILSYKRNISAPNTGLNVTENSTYNDGSVHNFGTRANCCGMVIIKSEGGPDGVGYIPFWTNGGGGVNYEWTALNPDTSALTGSSVSFNLGGSSGLDFTVSFAGGSGIISVQRTAGSVLYRVVIMEFFSG